VEGPYVVNHYAASRVARLTAAQPNWLSDGCQTALLACAAIRASGAKHPVPLILDAACLLVVYLQPIGNRLQNPLFYRGFRVFTLKTCRSFIQVSQSHGAVQQHYKTLNFFEPKV
jgi:hypothetical protein